MVTTLIQGRAMIETVMMTAAARTTASIGIMDVSVQARLRTGAKSQKS